MEAMLGISLYSHVYLKYQKWYVFVISYVFYSTKLEKNKEEQVLSRSEGNGGFGGQGLVQMGVMSQYIYM
jgi:hypothetical protein